MTPALEIATNPPVSIFAKISREEVTMAAHDLRNPLSCLVSTLELLESRAGKNASEGLRKDVRRGLRAAERMDGMIQRLLDNARQPPPPPAANATPNTLRAIVGTAVEFSLLNARKKGIRIHQVGPKILTTLDQDLLVEVVDNLVSNAVKFSNYASEIHCKIGQDARSAFIQVTDNGRGLTRKDLAKIGEPFQRLSAKPTAGEKSSGLGLWSARRIINSLGGELFADSDGFNKGATFMLRLPPIATNYVRIKN